MMGEPLYPGRLGRDGLPDAWAPSSAVSSFNQPAIYDSTLTTPVSLSDNSPTYHCNKLPSSLWNDSLADSRMMTYRNREPCGPYVSSAGMSMKSRESSATHQMDDISLNLSLFDSPQSNCPPTPYYGSFAVSGPQTSSTTETRHSASYPQHSSTPTRTHSQAPILIEPTPSSLKRRYSEEDSAPHRHSLPHHSIQPRQIFQSSLPALRQLTPRTDATAQVKIVSPPQLDYSHDGSKRRKSSGKQISSQPAKREEELTADERLLLELKDSPSKHLWKDIVDMYEKRNSTKRRLKEPALQMRYKRIKESLRSWTDEDTRALQLAKNSLDPSQSWGAVSKKMGELGIKNKWCADTCRKKWAILHPDDYEDNGDDETAYSENSQDYESRDNDHYWDVDYPQPNPSHQSWNRGDGSSTIGGGGGPATTARSPPEQEYSWIKKERHSPERDPYRVSDAEMQRSRTHENDLAPLMSGRGRGIQNWTLKR